MPTAPSMQSLYGVPGGPGQYRGLQDYPGLLMRSNQTYDDERQDLIDQHAKNMMAGIDDSISFPISLNANMANKMNPWSPFYQALQESAGGKPLRVGFADYNAKAAAGRDAAMQAARTASASNAMPFDLPLESYPDSVRSLYGDEGTRLLKRTR